MSVVVERRDPHGVLLRYLPDKIRSHHTSAKAYPSDRARQVLIEAERDLAALAIIFEHIEVSDIARTRLEDALLTLSRALNVKRAELGMPSRAETSVC